MDPDGCVVLDRNKELLIDIKITVAVSDLSPFPQMFYTTQFYNGPQSNLIGPILSSQLTPEELPSGRIVYVFTDVVYSENFKNECLEAPDTPISFDYNVALRDKNGAPYPIEDYFSILTPAYIAGTAPNGEPIIPSTVYAGNKNLCCSAAAVEAVTRGIVPLGDLNIKPSNNTPINIDGDNPTSIATGLNTIDLTQDLETTSDDLNNPTVFPNPFEDVLNIKFPGSSKQNTILQLWDINGRLVQEIEQVSETNQVQQAEFNTRKLDTGFYYCNIKNDTYSHTFKVLKLNK